MRAAVVTGAAGGIGRAVARKLLAEGYRVFAFDRDPITTEHPGLTAVQGDATSPDDVARLAAAVQAHGPLHVLVNAVGLACEGSFDDLTLETWRASFDLNLTSVFLTTQALLPLLRQAGGDRAIVNLSSTLARVADPQVIAYGTFKAALEHFSRTLALHLAKDGIRVVVVAPGPVSATASESRWAEDRYAKLNPLGRFATPEEVATLIAFLAGPDAGFITGSVHAVDGGDSALGAGWGFLEQLPR